MTEYFIALDLPLDEDLADFSALLWQQGVAHHIAEEGNRQLLRVGDAQQQEQVRALYSRLKTGELHIERRSAPTRSAPVLQRRSGPVVWVLLLLSIAGALLPQLDRSFESVALLTFYPLDLESGQLLAQWPVGEPWRPTMAVQHGDEEVQELVGVQPMRHARHHRRRGTTGRAASAGASSWRGARCIGRRSAALLLEFHSGFLAFLSACVEEGAAASWGHRHDEQVAQPLL